MLKPLIRWFAIAVLSALWSANFGSPPQVAGGEPASKLAEVIPPEGTTWNDLPAVKPAADDWPWWRGPNFDNKAAPGKVPPLRWSDKENVVWKADVPGRGHGSPSLWGDRIFLATADDKAEVQYLLCYQRGTGKQLRQTVIHRGGFMHSHGKGSHASSTAACDGARVFITFMVQDGIWPPQPSPSATS